MSRGTPTLDRRQLLRIFGAVAAAGATGGFAGACSADEPSNRERQPSGLTVRVGLVVPSSGPYARIGEDIRRGFALYLENNGNLLGTHNVELITVDEGTDAQSALAAVNGLLERSVVAIAGVVNPDALAEVALAVQARQVPLVNTYATPDTLINAVFVWRVGAVIGDAGESLGEYARLNGQRAYVMHEASSTGRTELEGFRRAFLDQGGELVNTDAELDYTNQSSGVLHVEGAANLSARFAAAAARNADTIFAAFTGDEALQVVQSYLALNGTQPKLVGTGNLTETIDLASAGALRRPIFTSMYYAANLDNDANHRFVTEYQRRHGIQPSSFALAGFDGAGVLGRAAALVPNQPDGSQINQAISRLGQIESPRGSWTFNINRSPQQKWYLRRLALDGMVPSNQIEADLIVLG